MNPDIQKVDRPFLQKRPRTKGIAGIFRGKSSLEAVRDVEEKEILKCIKDSWDEWQEACASFEHASEEKLVDYCTYKMKACEEKYAYFVGLAKEKGLSVGIYENRAEDARLI